MNKLTLYYALTSNGFIIALNFIAIASLWQNYINTRKVYLALACAAGLFAALRQIPGFYLGIYPDAYLVFQPSQLFHFMASLFLLAALMRKIDAITKNGKVILGLAIGNYLFSAVYLFVLTWPITYTDWYLTYSPTIVVSILIAWMLTRSHLPHSPSKLFLLPASLALVVIRCLIPAIESDNLFNLLYYMEALLFPILLIALTLQEVEEAYQKVDQLLEQQKLSVRDLRFILDNSLDVILTANEGGLLQTWNKRAEEKFGYSTEQVINKLHIDDLFCDNYWHRNSEDTAEFSAKMEHIDGKTFDTRVRMKSVANKQLAYSIYVFSDQSTSED